ncbi:hypothetical protein SDC9_101954 [bioreactor metagenome]|uniref:Uncharacterized protein n=1 Tax=bioreactor metagenome TaxID=1076179 RepID=A0A645AS67_9ZZZZ
MLEIWNIAGDHPALIAKLDAVFATGGFEPVEHFEVEQRAGDAVLAPQFLDRRFLSQEHQATEAAMQNILRRQLPGHGHVEENLGTALKLHLTGIEHHENDPPEMLAHLIQRAIGKMRVAPYHQRFDPGGGIGHENPFGFLQ